MADERKEVRCSTSFGHHSGAVADALHVAAAAVAGVECLLTLNCRHIANVHEPPRIHRLLDEQAFGQLLICTPALFLGGDDAEDRVRENERGSRGMIQTIEAVVDDTGRVRLLGEIHVTGSRRALLTVLDEPAAVPDETALLGEAALAVDWLRPEEDAAWSHLQPGNSRSTW